MLLPLGQISKRTHSLEVCHLFAPATTLVLVHEAQKQNSSNRDRSCVGAQKAGPPLTKGDLAIASAGVADCNEEGECGALIGPIPQGHHLAK